MGVGRSGYLYKPAGENTGRPLVILPAEYSGNVESVELVDDAGNVTGTGSFRSVYETGGGIWNLSTQNGSRVRVTLSDGRKVEYGGGGNSRNEGGPIAESAGPASGVDPYFAAGQNAAYDTNPELRPPAGPNDWVNNIQPDGSLGGATVMTASPPAAGQPGLASGAGNIAGQAAGNYGASSFFPKPSAAAVPAAAPAVAGTGGLATGTSATGAASAVPTATETALGIGNAAPGVASSSGSAGFMSAVPSTAGGSGWLGATGASPALAGAGYAAGAYTGYEQLRGAGNVASGQDLTLTQQAALALPTFGASFAYNPIKNLFDKNEWKQEKNRLGSLKDEGVFIPENLTEGMPSRGRSKDELVNKILPPDYVGRDADGNWVNNKFAQSRDVRDLQGTDIVNYSAWAKNDPTWFHRSVDERVKIADAALQAGAVKEHHGTIDLDFTKFQAPAAAGDTRQPSFTPNPTGPRDNLPGPSGQKPSPAGAPTAQKPTFIPTGTRVGAGVTKGGPWISSPAAAKPPSGTRLSPGIYADGRGGSYKQAPGRRQN